MGGSGSNGVHPTRSGSSSHSGEDSCNLNFRANLFGSVSNVIALLNDGDFLDVRLHTQNQTQTVAAFTRTAPVHQAGTITGVPQLGDLVECLQQGHDYKAEILNIIGSTISLQIQRI